MHICKVWEINWTFPGSVKEAFISWYDMRIRHNLTSSWRMLFSACCWSIWLSRNRLLFDGKSESIDRAGDLVLIRVTQWFKAKFPHCSTPTWLAVQDPKALTTRTKLKLLRNTRWLKPSVGSVKFNVDAAQNETNGGVGIGGILRNAEGTTKVVFSKALQNMEIDVAEFMAIMEALRIYQNSTYASGNTSLIIETDSLTACHWCNNSCRIPWRLQDQAILLENFKTRYKDTQFNKIPREINNIEDKLAKAGIDRVVPLEAHL